ncbi:O-antigen ligase family protein [Allorhodopirellula solitaria]|uniref:O-antigen ligase family protein n=1 Tax=Allorhodopirellula solitaria TaxID=2527987 RepID=UPI0011B73501|nr:O-antigen ligase family protein [Allorhodopirellula solitaria]
MSRKSPLKTPENRRDDDRDNAGTRRNAYAIVGLGAAAAITVWTVYYPADSTALEQGHAMGATCMLMAWGLVAAMAMHLRPRLDARRASWWLDSSVLLLAGWILLAAWVTGGVFSSSVPTLGGDLRAGTNEAWWWIAAAGFLVTIRRVTTNVVRIRAVFGLLLGLGTLLAVHTLHQHYISLPETLREYLADPDAAFASLGLNAPPGSAARMVYENRMRDGGPTATFALANSLAGPLAMIATLGGGCLVSILASFRRHDDEITVTQPQRTLPAAIAAVAVLTAVFILTMVALFATGSRSGALSVIVVAVAATVLSVWPRSRRSVRIILASSVGLGVIVVMVWWFAGADSRLGQFAAGARETIELRLQYWLSTLVLLSDHPWFGAGPGNFQLVYQKYRDVAAHEMIAEPHNFIVETLACGGWIAGLLVTASLAAGLWFCCRKILSYAVPGEDVSPSLAQNGGCTADNSFPEHRTETLLAAAIASGAFFGLVVVWYYGISHDALPDFEAHQYAIPAAMIVMGAWWMITPILAAALGPSQCVKVAAAATACGLVHLCFSGGWTVPGVILIGIWFAGIATSVPTARVSPGSTTTASHAAAQRQLPSWSVGVVGGVLFLGFLFFSLRPILQTRAAMAVATEQFRTNRINQAESTLRSAIQNDPLAQDAPVWLASIENRKLMQSLIESPATSARHQQDAATAMEIAVARAGNDPAVLRAIGDLLLQRYQVAGRIDDLVQAEQIYGKAMELSPTQEAIVAQVSEIVRELTRRGLTPSGDSAEQLATRAETLGDSGDMVTRKLELQPILPARKIGPIALHSPVQESAEELLRGQPDSLTQ